MQDCQELQREAVDYLQRQPGGTTAADALQPPTVLAIDATCDASELVELKTALLEVSISGLFTSIVTFNNNKSRASVGDHQKYMMCAGLMVDAVRPWTDPQAACADASDMVPDY